MKILVESEAIPTESYVNGILSKKFRILSLTLRDLMSEFRALKLKFRVLGSEFQAQRSEFCVVQAMLREQKLEGEG